MAFFGFLGIEIFFISIVSLVTGISVGIVLSLIDHKLFGNEKTASKREFNKLVDLQERI